MNAAKYFGLCVVATILSLHFAPLAYGRCQAAPSPPEPFIRGFCLEGPLAGTAAAGSALVPSANPPFLHWDLREFPGEIVPYSFFDGTADIPGLAEFGEVDLAFATWQAVAPAVIGFNRLLPGAGVMCPLHLDNHNMIGWNGINCPGPGDDVCLVPGGCVLGGAVAPRGAIVGPGPDGFVTTFPAGPAGGGDDDFDLATGIIRDGGDGIIQTVPNALPPNLLALTVLFSVAATGRILESDILFNDSSAWMMALNQAATPTQAEVQTVALHEIGHFIGLHHTPIGPDADNGPPVPGAVFGDFPGPGDVDADGDGVIDTPIMAPQTDTAIHTLSTDDMDGINFLYTPDLGDAPDPFAGFNRYPSLVHSTTPGRTLNGVQLFVPGNGGIFPANGAAHLFGFFGPGPAPRYQYEWLGVPAGRIDDNPLEGEALVPDLDAFDDGVTFGGPFVPGGAAVAVTVNVQTAADIEGGVHVYNDDVCLIPAGCLCGQAVAPGAAIVGPGPDGVVTTPANSGCFGAAGDDMVAVGGNIVDGGDGIIDTVPGAPMFINAWFDWNADGDWDDPGEHVIGGPAGAVAVFGPGPNVFMVAAPAGAVPGGFARFRLDYREDVGQVAATDPSLILPRGAAQFGEVEDYKISIQVVHLPINLRDQPDPVKVGSNLTYTIHVANTGLATATGVKVTDTLPRGVNFVSASLGCSIEGRTITCAIPSLAPDEKVTLQIVVKPTVPGEVRNRVTVTAIENPRPSGDATRTRVIQ